MVGKSTQNLNGVVAGLKLPKAAAYTELAAFVNHQCGTTWTPIISKGRWVSYYKKYKSTKHAYEDKGGTKYCITEADRKKGIQTIFQKLEHDCPKHRQEVNTDFVEEPPMNDDETDDCEEEGNSMTNENNLVNLITEMSNEHNVSIIGFTSSSASVGS